jgi:hypothetical protein
MAEKPSRHMTKVIPINANHPLVGTWHPRDEDESAEFTIEAAGRGFRVSGVDRHDGERFEISDVSWDGESLRFRSLMPSTRWVVDHTFRVLGESEVEHVHTCRDVWVRSGG